jgi:hypothetical protein
MIRESRNTLGASCRKDFSLYICTGSALKLTLNKVGKAVPIIDIPEPLKLAWTKRLVFLDESLKVASFAVKVQLPV